MPLCDEIIVAVGNCNDGTRELVAAIHPTKIKIIDYETSIVDRGFLHDENSLADWAGGVNTLAFSPDGKTVASGGDDCKVKLWDIKSKKLINEFLGHNQSVMSISFSPNGKLLASGSKDKTVRIWQLD
jgi:WD40 repeat protein